MITQGLTGAKDLHWAARTVERSTSELIRAAVPRAQEIICSPLGLRFISSGPSSVQATMSSIRAPCRPGK